MDIRIASQKEVLIKCKSVGLLISGRSKETNRTHVVNPHLIWNTNQIDFSDRTESLKTVNYCRIGFRLSEKIH